MAALLWGLISAVATSMVGGHPGLALAIGATGGLALGVRFWHGGTSVHCAVGSPAGDRGRGWWLCVRGSLLSGAAFLALLFANRLSVVLTLGAVAVLIVQGLLAMCVTRSSVQRTPLGVPVLMLTIACCGSLYAAAELRRSWDALCMLIAGIALFYRLANCAPVQPRVSQAHRLFVIVGVGVAASTLLVMQAPEAKLPVTMAAYDLVPLVLPRTVHANYVGGTLAFFLPAALLLPARRRAWRLCATAAIAAGLVLTQSRGALLAGGVGLILAGAYWRPWVRWSMFVVAIVAGYVVHVIGVEELFGQAVVAGMASNLQSRLELWQRAVNMGQDFACTGIGLRSFPKVLVLLYPLFTVVPTGPVPHAHNLFLDVVSSTGLPGFVAFWAVLGAWGAMVWEILQRSRARSGERHAEVLGVALAGGMVGHLLYGVSDAVVLGEKAGVVFWLVLGLTAALWNSVRTMPSGRGGVEPGPCPASP